MNEFVLDPAYLVVPKDVQALINGLPSSSRSSGDDEQRRPRCTQCRALTKTCRCGRCQAAHYCSKECQKKHFGFHKKLCEQVATVSARATEMVQREETYKLASTEYPKLVEMYIIMGYRETDTVKNGEVYYRKALHYCMESMKVMGQVFFHDTSPMEDKVLVLLSILSEDDPNIIWHWIEESQSPRKVNLDISSEVDRGEQLHRVLQVDDFPVHMALFLCYMRSLATYRRNLVAIDQFQTISSSSLPKEAHDVSKAFLVGEPSPDGRLDMDVLTEEIPLIVRAIQQHGHGSSLTYLRDTVPFSPEHAPMLVRSEMPREGPTIRPPELWNLVQDCIFTTPGVNDILHEFVPEEDDPIE